MEQHEILRIPMTDSIFDELDEAYVGEKETAHDFVWGLVRHLCKDAKLGKLNKICQINSIKDGVPFVESVKLKGMTLEELPSNPDWIPQNMELEDIKYFEHSISDKTLKYLKVYGSFTKLRHDKYGTALEIDNERKLETLEKGNAKPELIEDAKKGFSESSERFQKAIPKCLEEVVFNAIYPSIHKKVTENVEKMFDKENEQFYPKEAAVKKA